MSIGEITRDLVSLCRRGNNAEAIAAHYSDQIVSVESTGGPEIPVEMKGIEAIKAKNQWWTDNNEVHSSEVNGPYIGDDQFTVEFKYDFTQSASGKRLQMNEMGLYTVADGKIVHEHFFYNPGA